MNFWLYLPHFLDYLGETFYDTSASNALQHWWVSWESVRGGPRWSYWRKGNYMHLRAAEHNVMTFWNSLVKPVYWVRHTMHHCVHCCGVTRGQQRNGCIVTVKQELIRNKKLGVDSTRLPSSYSNVIVLHCRLVVTTLSACIPKNLLLPCKRRWFCACA